MKKNKYWIILTFLFVILILIEFFAPKNIDWSSSFSIKDKIPYVNYLLYNELNQIFTENKIIVNSSDFYKYLNSNNYTNTNLIIINYQFLIDECVRTHIKYVTKHTL